MDINTIRKREQPKQQAEDIVIRETTMRLKYSSGRRGTNG
jgi:hypothetical protein